MQAPRTLAAAFLSAALILTSGLALADNGKGKGNPHGAPAGAGGPNSAASGPMNQAGPNSAQPGAAGQAGAAHGADSHASGPMGASSLGAANGNREGASSSQFRGDVDTLVQNKVTIKLEGATATRTFDVDDKMAAKIKSRENDKNLVFFSTDGQHITSVSRINETVRVKVVAINGITVTVQTQDGETRLLGMDKKSQQRLHLRAGSDLDVTTRDDNSARVVSEEQLKKHWSDKFAQSKSAAKKSKSNAATQVADNAGIKSKCGDAAKSNAGRSRAFANQMSKDAANDASGHNPPGLPHECLNPAGHTRGWCKSGTSDVDCSAGASSGSDAVASSNTESDQQHVAKSKCGDAAKNANGRGVAFANQMAKDARNDASGHNPPGLPHECVNPAGHTRGWCKSGTSDVDCSSSSSTTSQVAASDTGSAGQVANNKCAQSAKSGKGHGVAFANQMALDARNDASGHNPPGLPHECVNPAGHTRGWCKSGSETAAGTCSSSTQAAAVATLGTSSAQIAGVPSGISGGSASSPNLPVAGRSGSPVVGQGPPGFSPLGAAPVAAGTASGPAAAPLAVAAAPRVASAAKSAKRPTRVLGASTGPASIALVRPLANTPCVWHKTAVLGASTGPSRVGYVPHRAYTGYVPHRPHVRTACH